MLIFKEKNLERKMCLTQLQHKEERIKKQKKLG